MNKYRVLLAMHEGRLPLTYEVEAEDVAVAAFYAWIEAGGKGWPTVDVRSETDVRVNNKVATVTEIQKEENQ